MQSVESIEVAATGQRLIFRDSTAEAVVFESFLPPQAPGLVPDGSEQEQRFEVLAGSLCFSVEGAETLLTAGGRLTVPPGTACRYWNSGTELSHLVAEIRPALEFERYAHAKSTKETAMELAHAYAKLPVQDVERARAFYRDVLDLEPYHEVHGHLYYDVAGVPLLLFPSSGSPSGDHDQFGLVVDDLDAALARLRERAVELEGDVMTREHMRAAWFKDSEGNLVSVAQFAAGSPFRTF
jgi:catechol 2,3-dioxygenase-like lactoylglutathione lyase family enzyme/quercetin dioxygenase-like cupin family protein